MSFISGSPRAKTPIATQSATENAVPGLSFRYLRPKTVTCPWGHGGEIQFAVDNGIVTKEVGDSYQPGES
jgi:hypothetical protein